MSLPQKRLTFFITGLAKGGAHQSALSWFELLRESGRYELDIWAGLEGWFTEQLRKRGFTYQLLPLPSALGAIRHGSWTRNRWTTVGRVVAMGPALLKAWWRIGFRATDGVVLTGGRDFLMLLPLVLRKRANSATIPQSTDWGSIPTCKLMCQLVGHVYAISQSVADSIIEMGVNEQKIKVLPLIYTRPLKQRFPDKMELRRRLGLPEDRPLVGMVGLIRSNKGQKDAVLVIDRVRREVPQALLVVAGAPMAGVVEALSYETEIKQLAKDLHLGNHVLFLGWRDDIPSVMRSFDVLFVPSHDREGVPRVILEGMEAALPMVASDLEQFREIIGAYDAGRLLPVADHGGWARETVELLKSQLSREALSRRARETWQSHYSEEAVRKDLLAAFDAVVSRDNSLGPLG